MTKEDIMRVKEEALRLVDILNEEEAEGRQDPWYVRDDAFFCKGKVIKNKYADIVENFEDETDDRRVAYNIYHQILNVCDEMARLGVKSNYIRYAVNQALRTDMDTIDEIIARFRKLNLIA